MSQVGGITFLRTRQLDEISQFCQQALEMKLWLDQGRCRIFQRGRWLLGFIADSEQAETSGILTLFLPSRQEVDREYERLQGLADAPPRLNPEFRIYQFFLRGPEGRLFEIQSFEHEIDWSFDSP